MRHSKFNFPLALTILFLCFSSCNNESPSEEKSEKDTSQSYTVIPDASPMPAYDPAMDPLNVGPDMSKKLVDTLGVKVYEFTAKPGQSWALHTHPDHTVYVLQGGKISVFFKDAGRTDTMNLQTGMAFLGTALTDSGKNIGSTTVKMLVNDIYRPQKK